MTATVLIVDDLAVNRDLVRMVLDHNGYETREADGGAAALRVLTREHPDLVLTDIRMPEMDGYSLARAIKADRALRSIPVVFYTAHYIEAQNIADASAVGVSRIIEKTGDLEELLDAVADALLTPD